MDNGVRMAEENELQLNRLENETHLRQDIPKKDRLLFIFLLFAPVFFINRSLNNDLWFLLNSGRYVLAHGFPLTEPFTQHSGFSFMLQQWLSTVIFWLTYTAGGKIGLLLLVACFYSLLTWALLRLNLLVSHNYFFVAFSTTILTSVAIGLFMVTRPYMISSLVFVEILIVLEKYAGSGRKLPLLLLPFYSALLINLHAAMWPLQFVLLLPYILDAFSVKRWRITRGSYPAWPICTSALLMFAAGLANPYGLSAMSYLLRSYGQAEINNYVAEMKAPDINTPVGKLVFMVILIVIILPLIFRQGRFKLRHVLLTSGMAYMALSSIRSFLLFLAIGVFPLSAHFSQLVLPVAGQHLPDDPEIAAKTRKRSAAIRKAIIVLIVVLLVLAFIRLNSFEDEEAREIGQLDQVARIILEDSQSRPVTVYNGYNAGSYLGFVNIKVYIDPRAEVFIKENNGVKDVLQEYIDLQTGRLHYKTFTQSYKFTHLIVDQSDILYTYLLSDSDYKLVFSTDKYYLFEPA